MTATTVCCFTPRRAPPLLPCGQAGSLTTANGDSSYPSAITLYAQGQLLVADYGDKRVLVISALLVSRCSDSRPPHARPDLKAIMMSAVHPQSGVLGFHVPKRVASAVRHRMRARVRLYGSGRARDRGASGAGCSAVRERAGRGTTSIPAFHIILCSMSYMLGELSKESSKLVQSLDNAV